MKKEIRLNGHLISPLVVGKVVYISDSEGGHRTSHVQCILERTKRYVRFETRNSIYHLEFDRTEDGHEQ